ncbi:MAG: hypothetical protein HY866_00250 [Chloroflexi bacterium]|nr:hypothetical protein [Chloroflexota bacterium]
MKKYTLLLLTFPLAVLILTGCSDPDPVKVYVTPTPIILPSPSATPVAAEITLVNAQSTPSDITPQPTPLPPPPGVNFGPIVAPNYTPEPLHTPLPATVTVQPCRVIIAAAQVSIYQSPDRASSVIGTALVRERLVVQQVTTDAAGVMWASANGGWLPLSDAGIEIAQLDSVRACEILTGREQNTMLMGLHIINDTANADVLAFVQRMVQSGHPLGSVKGLNSTEPMLNQIKEMSPQTVIIYRSLLNTNFEGLSNCPPNIFDVPDPIITAQDWMAGLKYYWDQVDADYFELFNECPASMEWIAQFSIESMRIANEQGRCLLLFSFPGGNPDMQYFNDLLPAYQYAVDHACQPGRTHGIALHAWSLEDDRMASESDVWIAFRHRILYERLLLTLPAAANLPVYLTEMGIGGGTFMPPCDTIVRDVLQYTYQVEEDPYVKGFNVWSIGTGAQWYDITPCLPALGDSLISYYNSTP